MSLLDALSCNNTSGRPPVWLMRQAGRYMPDYQQLRQKHSIDALFHTPDLAAEVTLLPEKLLGVDALILFSDILMLCELFGLKVSFIDGLSPTVEPRLVTPQQVAALRAKSADEMLPFVRETITRVKGASSLPLLGFCGAPFTVASYMFGGVDKALAFASEHNKVFHELLNKLAAAASDLLNMQVAAGCMAVQIFDSWGGTLGYTNFLQYSHLYLQKVVAGVSAPTIVFSRNSSLYPRELSALNPSAISYDWFLTMKQLRERTPEGIAIQGNLDPTFLRDATGEQVAAAVRGILHDVGHEKGVIINLGHGVLPTTPLDNVRIFVDTVKSYSCSAAR